LLLYTTTITLIEAIILQQLAFCATPKTQKATVSPKNNKTLNKRLNKSIKMCLKN